MISARLEDELIAHVVAGRNPLTFANRHGIGHDTVLDLCKRLIGVKQGGRYSRHVQRDRRPLPSAWWMTIKRPPIIVRHEPSDEEEWVEVSIGDQLCVWIE